ncbi:Hypothetical predicted protein [Drosophila guanche]|uniref:Uncharacterized protein n=1 Tax=Drosophila guanche TaxID=7266 RepID=A0A3B0K9D6_DROGU|nr:Hypothetical predicted protein [Drosophila guanche]
MDACSFNCCLMATTTITGAAEAAGTGPAQGSNDRQSAEPEAEAATEVEAETESETESESESGQGPRQSRRPTNGVHLASTVGGWRQHFDCRLLRPA